MARGRKKQYDKTEVLNKAMEVFWRKGYEGAHLQELVEHTGLNRFSLYSEFEGKEGLFCESLAHYLSLARETYQSNLAKEQGSLQNIYDYFNGIQFGSDYHGCMMVNTLNNRHAVPEKGFNMANDFAKWLRTLYLNNLQAAVKDGTIPATSPIDSWCDLLLSFDLGLSISGIPLKNINSALLAQQCLDALIKSEQGKA